MAESVVVEENIHDLQFFLCPGDCGPHKHICVILHCFTCNCYGA